MWKSSVYSVDAWPLSPCGRQQRPAFCRYVPPDVWRAARSSAVSVTKGIRCGLWSVFQLTPLALPFPAALYGDVFVLYGMKAKIRCMTSSWNILLTAVLTREKCLWSGLKAKNLPNLNFVSLLRDQRLLFIYWLLCWHDCFIEFSKIQKVVYKQSLVV